MIVDDDKALWTAIYELWCLLNKGVNSEREYQKFFENNRIAFTVFDIDCAESFEKSSPNSLPYDLERNYTPEPDFIGVNKSSGVLSIVELKTPFVGSITTSRIDGKRLKFKAEAEQYISQSTEYKDSIHEHSDARKTIHSLFKIDQISDYRILLIYALSEENDVKAIANLCSKRSPKLEVIFYDVLLEKMIDQYSISRRDLESRLGKVFVFHLVTPLEQQYPRAFIGEYGCGDRNRLSVFLENDYLFIECIDSNGFIHQLSSSLVGEGPHYVRFEFSNDQQGIYMSLNVNNEEQDLRVGGKVFDFDLDVNDFTLGADSKGQNGAAFLMIEHYVAGRTMKLIEKLGSYDYFLKKTQGELKAVKFKPESYLIRTPEGNLKQEIKSLKPEYVSWNQGE
jgi:hypothetical protein